MGHLLFLSQLKVYNARGIQIFSFLGDRLDQVLMQRLGMPYKMVGEHGLSTQLLVECFLDRRKPIMLLLRDNKIGNDFKGYLPWHLRTIEQLKACGVRIANLWSVDLKNAPTDILAGLYESIRMFAEESGLNGTQPETPNLERDAQAGPHEMEATPAKPQHSGHGAGI